MPEEDVESDVKILNLKIENYHKEKNQCKDTCIRFGERIGHLETEDALKSQTLNTFDKLVSEISKDIKNLRWQVALIVGGILALSKIVDIPKFFH